MRNRGIIQPRPLNYSLKGPEASNVTLFPFKKKWFSTSEDLMEAIGSLRLRIVATIPTHSFLMVSCEQDKKRKRDISLFSSYCHYRKIKHLPSIV
jgi:hypothetical protein